MKISEYSAKGQLSLYDVYSGIRDLALIALSFVVVNINQVEAILTSWGLEPFYVSFLIFFLVEMGRKYTRDYQKEVIEEATVNQIMAEIEALE